jgi:hypothetical protein
MLVNSIAEISGGSTPRRSYRKAARRLDRIMGQTCGDTSTGSRHLALVALSDADIERVTAAVQQWCSKHHVEVDSDNGRRALPATVDLLQAKGSVDLLVMLSAKMDSENP